MTKTYLSISADTEYGEGDLPKATRKWIESLIKEEPLLAADILQDILSDVQMYYNEAVLGIYPSLKRQAKHEA